MCLPSATLVRVRDMAVGPSRVAPGRMVADPEHQVVTRRPRQTLTQAIAEPAAPW
jgi:hypothetical protein